MFTKFYFNGASSHTGLCYQPLVYMLLPLDGFILLLKISKTDIGLTVLTPILSYVFLPCINMFKSFRFKNIDKKAYLKREKNGLKIKFMNSERC